MSRIIRYFVLAAIVAGAGWAAWGFSRPYIFGVSVSPIVAVKGDIVQTIVASGRAETPSGVDVGSQIIGTVSRVAVREGDTVKAGDVLIALDDRQAKAGVEQAQAALRQAEVKRSQLVDLTLPVARQTMTQMEANRINARAQLDRALRLADRSVASGASVEALQRAFDVADAQYQAAELAVRSAAPGGGESQLAEAALNEAEAKLKISQALLRLATISSPINGTITMRDVEEGTVVQPGKTLLHLAPDLPKQLVVQIDERNLGLLHVGQKALVSADAKPDVTFPAVVSFINSTIDADRGSVEVKFSLPDPPAFLKENMTVSVDIEVARRDDTLLLPLDAVRNAAGGKPTVLVVEEGRAVEKAVVLGARDAATVEILKGLAPGDRVVPAGAAKVLAGDKVEIREGRDR